MSRAAGADGADPDIVEQWREFFRACYDSRGSGDGTLDLLAQDYPDEESLRVDYHDLATYDDQLAQEVLSYPDEMLEAAREALRTYDFPADPAKGTESGAFEPNVRFANLDAVPSYDHIPVGAFPEDRDNELVVIEGQVTKVAQPQGKILQAAYQCVRCGTINYLPGGQQPHECEGCERQGPFEPEWSQIEKGKAQTVRLQRPPEHADAGGQAPNIDLELDDDLCGAVTPGDRVHVAAALRPEIVDEDDGTFEYWGDVNGVEQQETDYEDLDYEEYEDEIKALAAEQDVYGQIVDSIKPSHHGDEQIKQAIALQMFGGVDKELPDGTRKRGQSHILLMGDPGTDKSGLIFYAQHLTPRSVYTSGKSATAAGLTCAAVQSDFGDGGWTLEAGALVQAHRGLCAIDEFDKMDEEERSGVQEALSEGTISPSKAGISNVTLPAETTVLAAANPKYGRFDPHESVAGQIDLDPALISRFDLIFTMDDQPDREHDETMADHMNDTALAGELLAAGEDVPEELQDSVEPAVDPELLRHYIAYAREELSPVMSDDARRRFKEFYVSLRSEGYDADSPVPVTARKMDALHRLGEAAARLRLSETVSERDADRVIDIVRSCLEDVGVDPETGELDADVVETGQSKAQRDRMEVIKNAVAELALQNEQGAPMDEVIDKCQDSGYTKTKITDSIEGLKEKGELYEPSQGFLRST